MGPPPPDVIDLTSASDDDDTGDLKRAIAMSLGEAEVFKSPDTKSETVDPPNMTAFGSMLLDRKKMEEERQARIAQRKRPGDSLSEEAPNPQRPRLACKAITQGLTGQGPKVKPLTSNNIPSTCSLPFAKGAVKKTWAYGCERNGDEIKADEVFQKDQLKLAVLASYQWDDDWLLSKIDISRTRLICVAYARDEAHKDQMRANVPSSHVRFCFPPMGVYGAMHAKIQLLKFTDYLRIVVPSGNLTRYDWGETGVLENILFLIDLPLLAGDACFQPTPFSTELFRFLGALGLDDGLISSLEKYNFAETKRYGFVHTIAGSHTGDDWQSTGYPGLARTLNDLGLASDNDTPVDVDFVCSSLGSLKREYLSSLYAAFKGKSGYRNTDSLIVRTARTGPSGDQELLGDHFRVYFPSQKTVSGSRGGSASAGTITFQSGWWKAPTFPRELLRDCVCRRQGLLIHSKVVFVRHAPSDGETAGWAYVGSANLSESAWGRLVKDKASSRPKMTCRNWECGVVISAAKPQARSHAGAVGAGAGVATSTSGLDGVFGAHIPIPMQVPAAAYDSADPEAQPWFFR